MNKGEKGDSIGKVFWQQAACEEEDVPNVLSNDVYSQPATTINSAHVDVRTKPWLLVNKPKLPRVHKPGDGKIKMSDKVSTSKQNTRKMTLSNENPTTSAGPSHVCSLAELRPEDKQKVADLVREMAKFSEKKDIAVKELDSLKTDFSEKLKEVEDEKQRLMLERDELKEKLLRYELVLSEIKTSNTKGVETILNDHVSLRDTSSESNRSIQKLVDAVPRTSPDEYPGNSRTVKSGVADNASRKNAPNEKDMAGDLDGITDLFFKQQDKFHLQQEILQGQIEQLQKLQEGILLQQEHLNVKQPENTAENMFFAKPNQLSHSQKLQSYISKQSSAANKSEIVTPLEQEDHRGINSLPVLVEDTILEENGDDLVSVKCLNSRDTSSSVDTAVQTEYTPPHVHEESFPTAQVISDPTEQKSLVTQANKQGNSMVEMCVGTDDTEAAMDVDSSHRKYGQETLELCKQHVDKLGEVLKSISSEKSVHRSNLDENDVAPKVNLKNLRNSVQEIRHKDSGEETLLKGNGNTSSSSALQQQHFRPSSMLELIEGIEPPSASTSIASSCKDVSSGDNVRLRTPLSPTNTHPLGKVGKVKHERGSKLQKVYGGRRDRSAIPRKGGKTPEDIEEQKMIADVFFVR